MFGSGQWYQLGPCKPWKHSKCFRCRGVFDRRMKVQDLFNAGPHTVDWNRVAEESFPLFALAADIKKNGLKEPILLKDGKIAADGIHRIFVLWLMGYKGEIQQRS